MDALAEKIKALMQNRNVWLILLSRCRLPMWLSFLRMRYLFVTIEEEELCLSRTQHDEYLRKNELLFDEEKLERIWNYTKGHPLSLALVVDAKGDTQLAKRYGYDYLDNYVCNQWESNLHDFLIQVSIVDEFTPELAAMITGNANVTRFLERAQEVGNFFVKSGQDNLWRYRLELIETLRRRLKRKKSPEQIKHLYANAALYYELKNEIPKALEMYRQSDNMEGISKLLVDNARKDVASGHYFELRKYYLDLPERFIEESPELMAAMSMLHSTLMNDAESDRWYEALENFAKNSSGSLQRDAKSRLLYLDIARPHTGSADVLAHLTKSIPLLISRKIILPELSVTSNLPSLLNGGLDFCEWSKKDREIAATIGSGLELAMGQYGNGMVSLALAESFLEKGADRYEVMALASKGKMQADSGGKIQMSFVAVGIKVWCAILEGEVEDAKELLSVFEKRVREENVRILPNLEAFLVRCALYQGELFSARAWLENAPDELEEFCTVERFRYLTKVRVYLAEGKDRQAYNLLQQMLYYADRQHRTLIRLETKILLAITLERKGDESWLQILQEALSEAEEYHFVRIFSREGAAIYPLITSKDLNWKYNAYKEQVLRECRRMAAHYPDYLKSRGTDEVMLSSRAVEILRLQASGHSTEQIAALLHISEATVKYHNRETYRKLGVNNKSAAIHEARKRKLV